MNWEAIGAIGEIIGALAVVASLAYLALQIRHSAASTQFATELEASKQFSAFVARITHDEKLERILPGDGRIFTNKASAGMVD
jgi:hypothetical protein